MDMLVNNESRSTRIDQTVSDNKEPRQVDESEIVELIYLFAEQEDQWFNLLLGIARCITIAHTLPEDDPLKDVSQRLVEHFQNAIKICSSLNTNSWSDQHGNSLLDQIPMAVGLIDQHGRIVELNSKADEMIKESAQWRISGDLLQCVDFSLEQRLAEIKITPGRFGSLSFRSDDNHQGQCHITCLPETESHGLFYFSIQTDSHAYVNKDLLRRNYRLTDAEILVVESIICHISVAKAAEHLQISPATVRDHLSSIYSKLEVNRKPDLIRKVLLQSLLNNNDRPSEQPSQNADRNTLESEPEVIVLKDGRKLSYMDHKPKVDEHGPAEDTVLIMHNVMGSSFELPPGIDGFLNQNKVRVIVPDRPGYGDSDPVSSRRFQTWCGDIETLLDTLNINKVKVIGHSIGGIYAMSMAEYLPERIEKIALVCSLTRLRDIRSIDKVPLLLNAVIQTIRYAPFLIEMICKMGVGHDFDKFYKQQLTYVRPKKPGRIIDQKLLNDTSYKSYCLRNFKHSTKQGVNVWAEEFKTCLSEWPFEITNKEIPYQIWHGDYDDVVPLAAVEHLVKDLNVELFNKMNGETHLLFPRNTLAVFEQLVNKHESVS